MNELGLVTGTNNEDPWRIVKTSWQHWDRATESGIDAEKMKADQDTRRRLAKDRAEQTEKRLNLEKTYRVSQRAVVQSLGPEALGKYDSRELFDAQMAANAAKKQFDREQKQAAIPDYANLAGNLDRLLEAQSRMIEHDKERVEQLSRQKEAQSELLKQTRDQVDAAKNLAKQSHQRFDSKLSALGGMSTFDRAVVHQIAQRVKTGERRDADMRKLRELGIGKKITDPYFKKMAGPEGEEDLDTLGEEDEVKDADKNAGKCRADTWFSRVSASSLMCDWAWRRASLSNRPAPTSRLTGRPGSAKRTSRGSPST